MALNPFLMPRVKQKITSGICLVALIFAQLAVSAYACSMQKKNGEIALTNALDQDTADGCAEADKGNPNLCRQHCQQGSQLTESSTLNALDTPVLPLLGLIAKPQRLMPIKSAFGIKLFAYGPSPPATLFFSVLRI